MNKEDERKAKRTLFGPRWEIIFAEFYFVLTVFAKQLTNGNSYAAEDLVQDTICRVIEYSPNPEKIKNPLAYLKRTLRNLWIDAWRKRKEVKLESIDNEQNTTLLNEMPKIPPTAILNLENKDLRAQLRVAMVDLDLLHKNIFKLHLLGYDCDEIAAKLGQDGYFVRHVLNAVRAKIRYRLGH